MEFELEEIKLSPRKNLEAIKESKKYIFRSLALGHVSWHSPVIVRYLSRVFLDINNKDSITAGLLLFKSE